MDKKKLAILLGAKNDVLEFSAVTTGAETLTLTKFTLSVDSVISWGDGSTTSTVANSEDAITHDYAGAGTWSVKIKNASKVTKISLSDAKINGFDTVYLRNSILTDFRVTALVGSKINTVHMRKWNPAYWYCYSMPTATTTWTINASDISGWVNIVNVYAYSNELIQANVDSILRGMWLMFPNRLSGAGTINVGTTNAAPSGVYQAANPPTTGLEYRYELLNDSQEYNPTRVFGIITVTS